MSSIYLELKNKEMQFVCTKCYNCKSLFGLSLCKVKNRGCCMYYPKYTLYELHKMSKSELGLETLNKIIHTKGCVINNYYIYSKGYFDETSYDTFRENKGHCSLPYGTKEQIHYLNKSLYQEEEDYAKYEEYDEFNMEDKLCDHKPRVIQDKSLFFKACPFVKAGSGCTIPVEFRSFICNLFICDEITEEADKNPEFNKYIKERDNYVSYINWQNVNLQELLEEKHLDLVHNFKEVIDTLSNLDFEKYDFTTLKKIDLKNI